MPEAIYQYLVQNAATKWPRIVRALRRRHPDANQAAIEDCAIEAIEAFSNPKNLAKIRHPEKPLHWLDVTAEHLYCRECQKTGCVLHFEELAVEPGTSDYGIESLEIEDEEQSILDELNEGYAAVLKSIDYEGNSFQEIAERENKPVKAIYDRYEHAKKRAREAAVKLQAMSPPQQEECQALQN